MLRGTGHWRLGVSDSGSFDDKYSRPIQGGRGKDAVHDVLTGVLEEANRCTKIMDAIKKPLRMPPQTRLISYVVNSVIFVERHMMRIARW